MFEVALTFVLAFAPDHGYDFQTDILLYLEFKVSESQDDVSDFLDHGPGVLPQLVHGDGFAHQLGQAGLQGHQVGRYLGDRLGEIRGQFRYSNLIRGPTPQGLFLAKLGTLFKSRGWKTKKKHH